MLQRIAVIIGTWWQCAMELLPLHHCHQAVPHLDKLSLYLSSPPPVSSPPPSHHYFPLPGLSSPHSSPQSLDLLHAASIPVTALSHIIQPRNMYAVAGSSLQGGTSTAEVGVKSSLASLPDPQPQVSTDFLLCCLPFPHMTSVKCSDDTSTLPFFYVECCMQGILWCFIKVKQSTLLKLLKVIL